MDKLNLILNYAVSDINICEKAMFFSLDELNAKEKKKYFQPPEVAELNFSLSKKKYFLFFFLGATFLLGVRMY